MPQEFTDSDMSMTESEFSFSDTGETAEGGAAEEAPDDAPIIRLVTLIISEAIRSRKSDIRGVCQEIDHRRMSPRHRHLACQDHGRRGLNAMVTGVLADRAGDGEIRDVPMAADERAP